MKKNVSFKSHGRSCAAWFFRPDGEGSFPLVVMAHGLAGIKEMRLDAYAEEFCRAGFACLVFDYRHFGESEGQPRQLLDIKKQHQDWLAAVAYGRTLPDVAQDKVVLWGTSLSGGHVLKVASMLPDITAVISQVPHLSGPASMGMNSVFKLAALTAHGVYDAVRGALGLAPHYVLAISEPEQFSLMNAPGECEGYLKLLPGGLKFDDRVAARFVLSIGLYSPVRALRKLKIPVLMQVALRDLTTPPEPGIKEGPNCSNVRLKKYETGHFQPYVEPVFTSIVAEQIAFLKNTVGG
ncbi:MAG: alpha/beta hydrolase [Spongiibacteraceae bacterium]